MSQNEETLFSATVRFVHAMDAKDKETAARLLNVLLQPNTTTPLEGQVLALKYVLASIAPELHIDLYAEERWPFEDDAMLERFVEQFLHPRQDGLSLDEKVTIVATNFHNALESAASQIDQETVEKNLKELIQLVEGHPEISRDEEAHKALIRYLKTGRE